MGSGARAAGFCFLPLPLSVCVTLGTLFNLTEPQSPHLYNGDIIQVSLVEYMSKQNAISRVPGTWSALHKCRVLLTLACPPVTQFLFSLHPRPTAIPPGFRK